MALKKSFRAQAALEFLTTYGWAFLVILIMIGTLAYFGILKPSRVLPSRCNVGAEFQCLDFQIDDTADEFNLRLKNNVGEAIVIQSITLASEGTTQYACNVVPAGFPDTVGAAEIVDYLWTTCNSGPAGMVAGEKGKVVFTVNYNTVSSGATYAKQVIGEAFGTVV